MRRRGTEVWSVRGKESWVALLRLQSPHREQDHVTNSEVLKEMSNHWCLKPGTCSWLRAPRSECTRLLEIVTDRKQKKVLHAQLCVTVCVSMHDLALQLTHERVSG